MGTTLLPSDAPQIDEVTVHAAGEIDLATAPALLADLLEAIRDQPTTVVADLGAVAFMDSSGVHALIKAKDAADAHGVALELSCPPAHCRVLLEATGFDAVLAVRP